MKKDELFDYLVNRLLKNKPFLNMDKTIVEDEVEKLIREQGSYERNLFELYTQYDLESEDKKRIEIGNKILTEVPNDYDIKSDLIFYSTLGTITKIQKLENLEKECYEKVNAWQSNMISYIVSKNINDLKIKYKGNLKIQNYLYAVQEDIVKHADQFKEDPNKYIINGKEIESKNYPKVYHKEALLLDIAFDNDNFSIATLLFKLILLSLVKISSPSWRTIE